MQKCAGAFLRLGVAFVVSRLDKPAVAIGGFKYLLYAVAGDLFQFFDRFQIAEHAADRQGKVVQDIGGQNDRVAGEFQCLRHFVDHAVFGQLIIGYLYGAERLPWGVVGLLLVVLLNGSDLLLMQLLFHPVKFANVGFFHAGCFLAGEAHDQKHEAVAGHVVYF